ncbi:MAG: hypothetical protein JWM05_2804 [Acidimicrobiales bacterium]|nr:hypothetical protein [Acidimicrobiales bacterium]
MSDADPTAPESPEVAHGELVTPLAAGEPQPAEEERRESVEEPAKVMRIGSMIKQLLEEVRGAELDGPARTRLREIHDTSIKELGSALSPDLRAELERVVIPFGNGNGDGTANGEGEPSPAELRIAQAQLVGWLEGLFHGIQATLFAQQMAARSQLEDMRRQLPPGAMGPQGGPGGPGAPGGPGDERSGTYL